MFFLKRWIRVQDAHELFHVLTSSLEEERDRHPHVPHLFDIHALEVTQVCEQQIHCRTQGVINPIPRHWKTHHPFHGRLTSNMICKNCQHQGRNLTLDHCLQHFISTESVKDVVCENCTKLQAQERPNGQLVEDQKTTFVKQLKLGKLPQCLCIHLQRLSWSNQGSPLKRNEHVQFSEFLALDRYKYRLAGNSLSQHQGSTCSRTVPPTTDGSAESLDLMSHRQQRGGDKEEGRSQIPSLGREKPRPSSDSLPLLGTCAIPGAPSSSSYVPKENMLSALAMLQQLSRSFGGLGQRGALLLPSLLTEKQLVEDDAEADNFVPEDGEAEDSFFFSTLRLKIPQKVFVQFLTEVMCTDLKVLLPESSSHKVLPLGSLQPPQDPQLFPIHSTSRMPCMWTGLAMTSSSSYLFRLMAVIVHHGDMHSGHFVTYRRSPPAAKSQKHSSQQWLWISDDTVRRANIQEVLSSCAYLLFYERVFSKSCNLGHELRAEE
ncbi:hypothetical protein AB205_0107890 [Aquarana catesbeiana]|uniref:Ubiquitin carboxyl-terminal hydrolase 30 n=1 Tax=Aquarana catesbeiana TaxID=8400 RepID=A0A2G9REE7_AQUCT|nr:hypothetical protein AB205_0107890 [Aquarana catesbeiana]